MWQVKPAMDMWSNRPAAPIHYKISMQQIVPQEDDKNCQSTKYNESVCSVKKCKENQTINMQPLKPPMNMWLPKPAVPCKYTRLCNDKNCRSTRWYKKMCSDKNCQEIPMFICSQRSQQENQVISGQWPSQVLWNNLLTSSIRTARTVNLQGNIPRNVNIPNVCVMAKTVNLPILCEI